MAHLEEGTEIPPLLYVRSEGCIRAASPASLGNSHSCQIPPIWGRNLATSGSTCQTSLFHTSGSKHKQGASEVRTTIGTHITLPSRKLQQTLLTIMQRQHSSSAPQLHLHETYPCITIMATVSLMLPPQTKIQMPLCTATWGKKQSLHPKNLSIRRNRERSGNQGREKVAGTGG